MLQLGVDLPGRDQAGAAWVAGREAAPQPHYGTKQCRATPDGDTLPTSDAPPLSVQGGPSERARAIIMPPRRLNGPVESRKEDIGKASPLKNARPRMEMLRIADLLGPSCGDDVTSVNRRALGAGSHSKRISCDDLVKGQHAFH